MKRFVLPTLAAALLTLPSLAQAQSTTASGTIGATAEIPTVLNFGTASPLSFGSVTPGQAATGTGYIALSRNVGVVFTLPDGADTGKLTRQGGTESIQPSFACGVGTTATAISSAFSSCAPATAGTGVLSLAAPTTVQSEFVIFNGSITGAQTNQTPGTYAGNIRITAASN
ncbi:MAG: hypothetical protein M3409_03740 [Gemmatimonadota bacterium]|jgi:spore coat protein U-like protein|nr:hypothetical protein [Gemmatimonadota bacterium]